MNSSGKPPRMQMLTMDGGPGPLILSRVLRHVERERPGFLRSVDLFAGTSNGAFMSLFLAARLSDPSRSSMEILEAGVDFSNELITTLHAGVCGTLKFLTGMRSLNSSSGLTSLFSRPEIYGTMTLGELTHRVLIVSLDACCWSPKYFRNFAPWTDFEPTLLDAALASSAFPMLLPMHHGSNGHYYVDGGLVANDPAMCAVSTALNYSEWATGLTGRDHLLDRLDNFRVLSMGAFEAEDERLHLSKGWLGSLVSPIQFLQKFDWFKRVNDIPWGWLQWVVMRPSFLQNVMLQGATYEVTAECKQFLGGGFYRARPPMLEELTVMAALFGSPKLLIQRLDELAIAWCQGPEMQALLDWLRTAWDLSPSAVLVPPGGTTSPGAG